jgi:hypothetical protein
VYHREIVNFIIIGTPFQYSIAQFGNDLGAQLVLHSEKDVFRPTLRRRKGITI